MHREAKNLFALIYSQKFIYYILLYKIIKKIHSLLIEMLEKPLK